MSQIHNLRAAFEFGFQEEGRWYADKELVDGIVDAILATELGAFVTHAGKGYAERPAKNAAAIRKAVASGKAGSFNLLDEPDPNEATLSITLVIEDDRLEIVMLIGGKALAASRRRILPSLEELAITLGGLLRPKAAFAHGSVTPIAYGAYEYPRARPPIKHHRYPTTSVLDVFDAAAGAEAERLATAAVPADVHRRERDGLVVVRWLDGADDDRAVAVAAGRHERWLSRLVEVKPRSDFNEHGDREDEPARREQLAPFTFVDPQNQVAYKAIIVDPRGQPDPDVWKQMTSALADANRPYERIRLIVPLRELALAVIPKATVAGFDAVLYPDDRNRLWNPAPTGWWIDDEVPEPTPGPTS